MKASELRIGNWIEVYSSESQVNEFDSGLIFFNLLKNQDGTNFEYDYIDAEFAKPILLTQEWLIKFGFVQKPDSGYWKDDLVYFDGPLQIFFKPNYNKFFFGIRGRGYNCEQYVDIEINYVHQLQNLYHALTGEELTILRP